MREQSPLEFILKRDRILVLTAVAGVTTLAWVYLLVLASGMGDMAALGGAVALARVKAWSALDFVLMFLMWAVMMVGMMLPSASPMILLFSLFTRKQREEGRPYVPIGAFVAGYLVVWCAYSAGATALQWALDQAALLSPMMISANPYLGGALLIAAGIYQWTPLKTACLKHCRSPFGFIAAHWRPGALGGLRMGVAHGAFCVGCCWALMALLFIGGVMNLLWVAVIAVFVLMEKVMPAGHWLGRIAGLLLLGWSGWLLSV